ncbi:MAG: VOC family protein [Myxococcota bacterium]
MKDEPSVLTPRLIVSSAIDAIAFYRAVFGAEELERYATPDGFVVHAMLSIRGACISLADARDGWYPPAQSEGAPVLMTLTCEDPDAVAALAERHGAKILIPVGDQFYGHREGRIRDPFGHLWILSRLTKIMTPAEIQKQVDAFDL